MSPSQHLAARYLEMTGALAGVDRTLHADDEMLQFIASWGDEERAELSYFRSGFEALRSLESVLEQCGTSLSACDSVLDFACGWGRLTRFLCHARGADRIWASDIAAGGVEFVGSRFGARAFVSTREAAALQVPEDRRFDAIWVGSLFSHLPRPSFVAWLSKLWSLLAEDGVLLFSTHGSRSQSSVEPDPSGFTFVQKSETRGRLEVADYGTAYVTDAALREMTRGLGISEPRGLEAELWGNQDLWVVRRGAPVPDLVPSATAFGRIEKAWFPQPGHAWVGGGLRLPIREGRPAVELWLDGAHRTACRVDDGHAHPHPGTVTPEMRFFQYYTEGPVENVRDVTVTARGNSGTTTVLDVCFLR